MPAPSIPGFHYDPSKRKYFKIQPNHLAPTNSKYSAQAVKREAEDQALRLRCEAQRRRTAQSRIARSRCMSHCLLGGGVGLGREFGRSHDGGGRGAIMGAWAQGLGRKTVVGWEISAALFAYDEATGTFPAVSAVGREGEQQGMLSYVIPTRREPVLGIAGVRLDSMICSLAVSPSRVLMTTAMGGSRTACVHITRLALPETINDFARTFSNFTYDLTAEAPMFPPSLNYISDVSTLVRSSNYGTTFWSSSARPSNPRSDFALGTSSGTILIIEDQSSWLVEPSMRFCEDDLDAPEVLAVDWLSQNVVLNGCRDGSVRLWDVRARGIEGTSYPLKHQSSITHVRKMNENRIVVAGIENQLCTYDLRFLTSKAFQHNGPTRPYLSFPTYRNQDLNGVAVGFDVKEDLIAAGTDNESVQLFDAATGRELPAGNGGGLSSRKLAGTARCVKFVESLEKEEMRLYVAAGENIEEWTW